MLECFRQNTLKRLCMYHCREIFWKKLYFFLLVDLEILTEFLHQTWLVIIVIIIIIIITTQCVLPHDLPMHRHRGLICMNFYSYKVFSKNTTQYTNKEGTEDRHIENNFLLFTTYFINEKIIYYVLNAFFTQNMRSSSRMKNGWWEYVCMISF